MNFPHLDAAYMLSTESTSVYHQSFGQDWLQERAVGSRPEILEPVRVSQHVTLAGTSTCGEDDPEA